MNTEPTFLMKEDEHFQTKVICSTRELLKSSTHVVVPPISLSSTFSQADPTKEKVNFLEQTEVKYKYSRSGNPNREILEKCLAVLDDAEYGLCFSSGLGAVTVICHLLQSGDHVVCTDDVYGGTCRYFLQVASRFNLTVTFVDAEDVTLVQKAIQPNTKLVWLESPSNPLMKVLDIKQICKIVHAVRSDIIMVVDNTFLTPFFHKPLDLGADVVIYSLTKYMNGHCDVVMGALTTRRKELYDNLKFFQNACGIVPSPFDCYLVDRGLKTLSIRMKLHMENALKVAVFLESHPLVEKVLHPGLPSHSGHEIAKRQWSGCSGMLSFYLKGGLEETVLFIKSLKYFICAESLGGYESLVEIPSIMTHTSVPPETREKLKITDNLIRVSVGLESAQDLISDLQQAFNVISRGCSKTK